MPAVFPKFLQISTKSVLSLSVFLGVAMPVTAATFGVDERIHELEQFRPGRVIVGYKTTTVFFLAGVYCSNDGYVSIPLGDRSKYRKLDAETIADMQARRKLPNPMPPYSVGILFYVFGYSLWLFILALLFGSVLYQKGFDILNYAIEAKDRLVYYFLQRDRDHD